MSFFEEKQVFFMDFSLKKGKNGAFSVFFDAFFAFLIV